MKKSLFVLAILLLSSTAHARSVECVGENYVRDAEYTVNLATASKSKISGIVITKNNVIISRIRFGVESDTDYRPTSPKYADLQRYRVDGERDQINLLLPEDKSGHYKAYLQVNMGQSYAETIYLNCSAD